MQTFLPYEDFEESARVLDYRRLGKQRVECGQILKAFGGGGWSHHPAVLMWKGYEKALRVYRNIMISEWVKRGYRNTMSLDKVKGKVEMPWWMGDKAFHASHRSNLLRKDSEYYGKFGWKEGPDLPYVWPGEL